MNNVHPDKFIVLIVDDVPENLAVLHDTLETAGYLVLVANNGKDAIQRAQSAQPDVILLDAMMPEMDGFEVCRILKSGMLTRHIPVVFMTGLTDSEHVVNAFNVGGVDYVTKPIRPNEVIARIQAHITTSRMMNQARGVLDAFGQAAIAIQPDNNRIVWQTPLARKLLEKYCSDESTLLNLSKLPVKLQTWVSELTSFEQYQDAPVLTLFCKQQKLFLKASKLIEDNQLIVVLREESIDLVIEALISNFNLTRKEAEVLYWTMQGKTNKDIGDILGSSPRTVNKHLEHVFEKLGVETRTAASAFARSKLQNLN